MRRKISRDLRSRLQYMLRVAVTPATGKKISMKSIVPRFRTSVKKREEYLRGTPLLLIAQSGTNAEDASLLLRQLANKAKMITVRPKSSLRMPKRLGASCFAICCGGELVSSGDEKLSEWPRRLGDFWFVVPGAPPLVARKRSRVLCLPRSAFTSALSCVNHPLVRKLASLDFISLMRTVPFFATIAVDALVPLAALFTFEAAPPGQLLYRSGDVGEKFYILLHGSVDLRKADGTFVKSFDTFFGAAAFTGAQRVYTTAAGEGGCAMLSIRKALFESFKQRFQDAAAEILSLMRRETRGRMMTSSLHSADLATKTELEWPTQTFIRVGDCVSLLRDQTGEVVHAAGTVASTLLMVYQGELHELPSSQEDSKWWAGSARLHSDQACSYQRGEFVGVDGVLLGVPRDVDVVAPKGSIVLAADPSGVATLCELFPALKSELAMRCLPPNRVPLEAVLGHPRANHLLRKFLESEYADESWHFYNATSLWRTDVSSVLVVAAAEDAPADAKGLITSLVQRANEISEHFVVSGAEREVNLPSACSSRLIAAIKALADGDGAPSLLDPTLFDEARTELLNLMRRDSLPRFVVSKPFQELREAMRVPAEEQLCEDDAAFEAAMARCAAMAPKGAKKRRSEIEMRDGERLSQMHQASTKGRLYDGAWNVMEC